MTTLSDNAGLIERFKARALWDGDAWLEAAAEIERLRAALLEIFDHECRTSGKSFIACTARDALWPGTALAGEKKDE